MNSSAQSLNAAEAARRLGISAKALRLYEERGLVAPVRTAAGWRTYGPAEMAQAGEIAALRTLGLSLRQVEKVLRGEPDGLALALAAHQATLEAEICRLGATIEKLGALRAGLARGQAPATGELAQLLRTGGEPNPSFALPWPWGGERFELTGPHAITFIIGPLGSGKTRLARAIAEHLPGATFLGLDRLADPEAVEAQLGADPALRGRVDRTLGWLAGEGAVASDALTALVAGIETDGSAAIVVDMVEDGLDHATQEAVIAHLRHRVSGAPPLFLMTRSSAILDLGAVGAGEAIILCPANHSPPSYVLPYPGSTGYGAVETCLATPEVRARTAGVIAMRPAVA